MRDPATTLLVSLPATAAAKLCVLAYETLGAFWAEPATDEELRLLHDLLDRVEARKEGEDGQS